ncbi:MAG: hypothetical protein WCW31_05075 [Patescibacteria group bacterium]|jgi:hypothetical protein
MKILKTCYYAVAAGALALPIVALAASTNPFQTANNLVGNVATNAGIQTQSDLPTMVGRIINIALGFIGILLLAYILFAGFTYMTAGGDAKKVDTAVTMIKNAVIGLLIVVAAFAISNFVLSSLINVTTG